MKVKMQDKIDDVLVVGEPGSGRCFRSGGTSNPDTKKHEHKIEFRVDESKKVTVYSQYESLSLYLLGMSANNEAYKEGVSVAEMISDGFALFANAEKLRPTVEKPLYAFIEIISEKGLEEYTLFAFYRQALSTQISTAIFDDKITSIPEDARKELG